MHVIATRTIREYADQHADARKPLMLWLETVKKESWQNINDLLAIYPRTDFIKVRSGRDTCIFNIKGNRYRLIVSVHFDRGKVYILRFMTHAEYSKDVWKDQL